MYKTYDNAQAAFIDRPVRIYDGNQGAWMEAPSAKTYDTDQAAWIERLIPYFILNVNNFNYGGEWWTSGNNMYANLVTLPNGLNDSFGVEWRGEMLVNPVLECTYSQGGTNSSKASAVNPMITFYYDNSVILDRKLYPTDRSEEFSENVQISVGGLVNRILIFCDPFTNVDGNFYMNLENLTINGKQYRFKE